MAKIMVQGATSSAGKSLLCTGLCRYFYKKGLKVFPFKSQNMSRNAFVDEDGNKIATAQVQQAFACNRKPDVKMNPVLLIPKTDVGSTVVLFGKEFKDMKAREYFEYKKELLPVIEKTFSEIESENDIVVVEGAGSPAEINLRENDIVNMGLAELVDLPVILVADIDRGGVFASLYGTVMLLSENERKRIKGLVINKFRGDKTLLDSGIEQIEKLTGIPVIGTIPYVKLNIPDEDSLVDYDKPANHGGVTREELEIEFDKLMNAIADNMDMKLVEEIAGL
ncbi:MAG: cobyric acid synthase [Ezakiella coagulans]|uniref:cobyric acid synthase n=1 Tax=Ezakiella coagulans TaxID=46507 RepID=UPI00050FA452|nr:cobyric acid synthase [Ezakiella coagulans]KGF07011.1 cobalamin biosynthesis protein CobQ [Tissierellia bacterium S7-1-4]UQK61392.1 cobyric acid synthase [Ezakiella coagulans]